jgi:hypothetical protein
LWNNVCLRCAIVLLLSWCVCGLLPAQKLLLNPQRLRRLQRDHERQTARWVNFETRVRSVADSPERGFELALYYAVTHDPKRGREAVDWALAHSCDARQVALVLDWAGDLVSPDQQRSLVGAVCPAKPSDTIAARDALFLKIATGQSPEQFIAGTRTRLLDWLQSGGFTDAAELYAMCEYLSAVRSAEHLDLRRDAAQFFSTLPAELLLSLKPAAVERPDRMTHLAALAMVGLDPNLPGSQFLQGWAMEGRQTIRDGSGVAYEFLWADPYLPGIGYQNLDPWAYDAKGRLFARTNWDSDACWIAVSTTGVQEQNCAPGWRNVTQTFGHLTLIPAIGACEEVPRLNVNETAILWQLRPRETLIYREKKQRAEAQADPAGMLRVGRYFEGKICRSR